LVRLGLPVHGLDVDELTNVWMTQDLMTSRHPDCLEAESLHQVYHVPNGDLFATILELAA
jgi:hypothetical protein